jgi:hypothetical protein
VSTACEYCGVRDALERHDGACPRAIELGLPRLAEGEEPIDPDEGEIAIEADAQVERVVDGVVEQSPAEEVAGGAVSPATATESPRRLPARFRATRPYVGAEDEPQAPQLWMSYLEQSDVGGFDAVIFDTEIDALRHAVKEGRKACEVQLGRSLLEQVSDV